MGGIHVFVAEDAVDGEELPRKRGLDGVKVLGQPPQQPRRASGGVSPQHQLARLLQPPVVLPPSAAEAAPVNVHLAHRVDVGGLHVLHVRELGRPGEEGVLRIARRVLLRNVEGVEAEEAGFHVVGRVELLEAHRREYLAEFAHGPRQRVQRPSGDALPAREEVVRLHVCRRPRLALLQQLLRQVGDLLHEVALEPIGLADQVGHLDLGVEQLALLEVVEFGAQLLRVGDDCRQRCHHLGLVGAIALDQLEQALGNIAVA
ncbi:enoyl-CoA hydratase [Babesia caballi]|uniref:Enoyl-CoA hydratase n=1 Tax=Babesia caballi TaxID=5871 RepID=A0AAV4LNB7_BABCB|nr:enoyl-CoA hydratase [Babesia caballi]